MNQEKIGKLIAQCRKEKKLTQKDLAQKLGVSDKSVSKWECGICLPDVSLYKELCSILDITLNDFFAGEKIKEEKFREVADDNLYQALENSSFTLKEKISFYTKKWKKDHRFELVIGLIFILFLFVLSLYYEVFLLFAIFSGFYLSIKKYHQMMVYVEGHAYGREPKLSIEEFSSSINRLHETKKFLSQLETREEAIDYLVKETKLSGKECSDTYDFLMNLNLEKY